MGKGSGRRPGEGYEDGWARIFGKPEEKQEQNQKDKCTEPFCQCEPGKCEWAPYDDKDDGK